MVLQWYLCYSKSVYSSGGTLSAMVYATKVKSVFCSMKSHTRWTTKMRETHQKIPQYSTTYLHTGPPLPMYLLPTKIRYQTRIIHLVGYKIKDFTSTPSQHSIKKIKKYLICVVRSSFYRDVKIKTKDKICQIQGVM